MTDSEVLVLDILVQTGCHNNIFSRRKKGYFRVQLRNGPRYTYASSLGRISVALKPSGKYTAVMPLAEVSGERDTLTRIVE